jgi:hypothetical protein
MLRPFILVACGLGVLVSAAHGQSFSERLKKARDEVREAAAEVKQEAGAIEKDLSGDAAAAPAAPAAAAVQPAATSGGVIDVEPYIRQATAIGNECRGLPDSNQFKPGCLKQCDDTVAILSQVRGQPVPPGADNQAREAVRVCGVMRDYAKDPANAGG